MQSRVWTCEAEKHKRKRKKNAENTEKYWNYRKILKNTEKYCKKMKNTEQYWKNTEKYRKYWKYYAIQSLSLRSREAIWWTVQKLKGLCGIVAALSAVGNFLKMCFLKRDMLQLSSNCWIGDKYINCFLCWINKTQNKTLNGDILHVSSNFCIGDMFSRVA